MTDRDKVEKHYASEDITTRVLSMSLPAVKIFQGTPEGGPVIVPHQEHLPPDVGAAKLWLSRRRPDLWRERQQLEVSGSIEHQLSKMTLEERVLDARNLVQEAKRRVAEARMTIEHQDEDEESGVSD